MREETPYAKEQRWRQDLGAFFASATEHWKALVGGSLIAILVSTGSMVFDWKIPPVATWTTAFCFVVVLACFLAYRDERRKAIGLADKLRPKIRTDCGPNVIGSRAPNITKDAVGQRVGIVSLRIAVYSQSELPVYNCRALLTEIRRAGKALFCGDAAILTFAPAEGEDSQKKTIHPQTTEYIDVIYVTETGALSPGVRPFGWNFEKGFHQIINEPGEYHITVKIVGDMPTEVVSLKFRWTGKLKTATLEKEDAVVEYR